LTHDRATIDGFAYARVTSGDPMAGVFVVHDRMPDLQAIDELILADEGSEQGEWAGRVVCLPL
jgi:hypothetical protein